MLNEFFIIVKTRHDDGPLPASYNDTGKPRKALAGGGDALGRSKFLGGPDPK